MRRKLIAGNWKMNLGANEARAMIAGLRAQIDPLAGQLAKDRDLLIAPAAVVIPALAQALAGSAIALGAQNMHWEDSGAFTGEVSAPMLKAFGVTHVIIGHSERRQYFNETDDSVNRKLEMSLESGLTPIVCVGEVLEEREASLTEDVLRRQCVRAFNGISARKAGKLVIAYEPCWAIGTGRTATPQMAADAHSVIRHEVAKAFGDDFAHQLRILYGGSVKPENASALMGESEIDGALVGGASLDPVSFAKIVQY